MGLSLHLKNVVLMHHMPVRVSVECRDFRILYANGIKFSRVIYANILGHVSSNKLLLPCRDTADVDRTVV